MESVRSNQGQTADCEGLARSSRRPTGEMYVSQDRPLSGGGSGRDGAYREMQIYVRIARRPGASRSGYRAVQVPASDAGTWRLDAAQRADVGEGVGAGRLGPGAASVGCTSRQGPRIGWQ